MKSINLVIALRLIVLLINFNMKVFAGDISGAELNSDVKKINDRINNLKDKNGELDDEAEGEINKLKSNQIRKQIKQKLSNQMAAAKKKCWLTNHIDFRVVNGSNPERSSLPWMVAIFRTVNKLYKDSEFRCGGSLISSSFVLSAAHCFINRTGHWIVEKLSLLSIRYGMHDLSSKMYFESKVKKVFNHPEYQNPDGTYSDIALVKLTKGVKYSNVVNPVCIPYLTTPRLWDKSKKGKPVLVSGWGRSAAGPKPKANVNLQEGYAFMEKHSVCKKQLSKYDPSTTICIGKQKNASKVCHGDSGSPVIPLILLPKNDRIVFPVVIGLVSFGDDECRGPDVLTKVESFIQWINKITSK